MFEKNRIYNNATATNSIIESMSIFSSLMGKINSTEFHLERKFANDYLFVYVVEGEFHLIQYGKYFDYKKGDSLIISLKDSHEYYNDTVINTTIYWFHFRGYPVENTMNQLKIYNKLPLSKNIDNTIVISLISKMFDIKEKKENNYQLELSPIIYRIFCEMTSEFILELAKDNTNKENWFKNTVLQFIQEHINEKISIQNLSECVGYKKTYFLNIYPKYFDISPHKLIINEKLAYSCELLQNTNFTICDISENLCFFDQSHFVKTFKNVYGITPKNYRKIYSNSY